MRVRKVAILGTSGLVAQRFQQRLANHPWFELVAVYGSPRTAGKPLAELTWHLPETRPILPEIMVRNLDSVLSDVDDFKSSSAHCLRMWLERLRNHLLLWDAMCLAMRARTGWMMTFHW